MIHLVVTGRNTRPFVDRHAAELRAQQGSWRCTWIDDASDDGTADEAEDIFAGDSRVTVVRRPERRGPLANIIQTVGASPPSDVIVLWDADDFFAHDRVLERLARAFEDPDIWMTYGSFRCVDGRTLYTGPYPLDVTAIGAHRRAAWLCAPPRAFRAWLFQSIPIGALLDDDGEPWRTATDQATCLPMLEMAREHTRHIDEVLYLYNDVNPLSDHVVRWREQTEACARIRRRPRIGALTVAP